MKKIGLFILIHFVSLALFAQENNTDSVVSASNIIHRDSRIDLLGKKMAEYNESLAFKIQIVDGYRLMVLNTTDRDLALKVRTILIQQFPDQKVYMVFLTPRIKLKMGNFINKEEAKKMQQQLIDMKIVPGNIFLLNEKVELKPSEKNSLPVEE